MTEQDDGHVERHGFDTQAANPPVEAAPHAVTVPLPVTDNEPVDEALARLAELDALPTAEHAQVYEDVQGRLHRALADLDGR